MLHAAPPRLDIPTISTIPSLFELERELAERSLSEFIQQAWQHLDPSEYKHGWHIDAIAEHLEAVSKGEIRRLIINIPPRHMKSLSVVAWRAWTWAQEPAKHPDSPFMGPHTRFLSASYAQQLSARDNVKFRRLIQGPWYQRNWGGRFALEGDQNQKSRFENSHGGYAVATSVDGAATGEGGDIILVDDPHNVREGESELKRETVTAWWDEVMSTRLNDQKTGAFVLIMQRIHSRDLCGHILSRQSSWDHLCLPAEYEAGHPTPVRSSIGLADPRRDDGELLWPERFDQTAVAELKTHLGTYGSAGQLQQRPAPRGGGMFKRAWFEIVRAAPAGGTTVRGWDLAATTTEGAAYTASVKMKRLGDSYFIEDVTRFRGSSHAVEMALVNTAKQDGVPVKISLPQDPGQAGKSQASYLVGKLSGFNARATPESGDKEQRAEPVSAQAEAGNIKLVAGNWNQIFLDELAAFPAGAYQDQVDALSRAFHELQNAMGGRTVKIKGI